jgi:hypothetical protein
VVELAWSHTTYSPALLLIGSALYSLALLGFLLAARRPLAARIRTGQALLPAILVLFSPLPVLLVAREHLPLIGTLPLLPPSRFCFGDPGVGHVIAFALPVLTTLASLRFFLLVPPSLASSNARSRLS